MNTCPFCEHLKDPQEALNTLQRCHEALGDLVRGNGCQI